MCMGGKWERWGGGDKIDRRRRQRDREREREGQREGEMWLRKKETGRRIKGKEEKEI